MKALAATFLLLPALSWAFPPYRSTDADTADPWVLEGRVGVRRVRADAERVWSAPLLRVNYGLPGFLEIVSEAEVRPDDDGLHDAALGFKWVPVPGTVRAGVEMLVLLPVSSDGGTGVESSLLVSIFPRPFRLHLNAVGFHDARVEPAEIGWKAGAIVEVSLGPVRPGLEIFARGSEGEDVQALGGAGVIVDLVWFDVRLGAHLGLSEAAPDLILAAWIATKLPTRRSAGPPPPPPEAAQPEQPPRRRGGEAGAASSGR